MPRGLSWTFYSVVANGVLVHDTAAAAAVDLIGTGTDDIFCLEMALLRRVDIHAGFDILLNGVHFVMA